MKKHMRRGLAWVLILAMTFGMLSLNVFAEDIDAAAIEAPVEITEPAADDAQAPEAPAVDETPAVETEEAPAEEETPEEATAAEDTDEEAAIDEEGAEEAEVFEDNDAVEGYERSIVMVDCGRKYFSVANIEKIIDAAANATMNTVMLGVGNDGLRFLLDDMTLTVNGVTYTSDAVKAAIHAGNETYSDFDVDELTQSEMNAIMTYANAKGIDIIPMINTPGHMDAILAAANSLMGGSNAYNGSVRTIDVTNANATAFTKALLQKYIDYFAECGCTMFNMGCDEYANDKYSSGGMGFGNLVSTGKYGSFVNYVNDIATMVKAAGMTPMAFNDGIYYNQNTSSGTFDKDIVICYWSEGWSGYSVASASYLEGKGHKLINTHGDYYWVLGKSDWQCTDTKAEGFSITSFQGGTIESPYGAMFCVWCDYPQADTDTNVANAVSSVIAAFGSALPGTEAYSNVKATAAKTITFDGTETVVTGFASATVTAATAPEIDGAAKVVAYEVAPVVNNAAYTGSAQVTLPIPEGWDAAKVKAFVVNSDNSVTTIAGTAADGAYTFMTPHFSVMGLAEEGEASADNTEPEAAPVDNTVPDEYKGAVTQKSGAVYYELVTNGKNGIVSGEQYLIVSGNSGSAYALNSSGSRVSVSISNNKITSLSDATAVFTIESNGSGYNLKDSAGTYLYPNATRSSGWQYSLSKKQSAAQAVTISGTSNVTISRSVTSNNRNTTSYIRYNSNKFSASGFSGNLYLFKKVTEPGGYVTDVAKLTEQKTAAAAYTDSTIYTTESWSAFQSALTAANALSSAQYETEAAANTAQAAIDAATYALAQAIAGLVEAPKTVNVTVSVGASKTETQLKNDQSVEPAPDASVATVSVSGKTVTIKGVAVGTTTAVVGVTTYNITVVPEDLTNKNITIEYWITNRKVTANGSTSMTLNAATSTVYSENGAAIEDLVPATGNVNSDAMVYWKAVRLASDNKQTTGSGVDKTLAGADFTRIRYYNGFWAYFDGTNWANFANGDQVVAYYLQKTTVTDEVTTLVVDWGPVKANWSDLNYLGTKYVLLDYSVVYESGEEVPTSFTNAKTLAFHCEVSTQKNGTYYRTIGMTLAEQEKSDYEVYMITATPSSDSTSTVLASTAAGNGTISYKGTEKVVWAETQADIDNSGLGTWTSISGKYTYSVGGEPTVPGMEIYRQQAMKITYYVRAKVTEDALTVNYVNATTGVNFYNYNIVVASGTTFNSEIALANPWKANLTNGSVTNSLGKSQTVSADLSTMPQIGASYRYSDYTCTKVERSDDGKTVTLYYTFKNEHKFVVDFGLPLKIDIKQDLNVNISDASATVTNAKYGAASVENGVITYTPNKVLVGVEQLSLNLTENGTTTTQIIYIYPATSVYYEEGYATYSGGWSSTNKGTGYQATSKVGDKAAYGYDAAYKNDAGASNGTEAKSTTLGDKATFSFTGTGVEIYANCTPSTGYMLVKLASADGSIKKNVLVYTAMKNGNASEDEDTVSATTKQKGNAYNVPVVSMTNMAEKPTAFTVTITHVAMTADDTSPIQLDGFRVFGTLDTANEVYKQDLEEEPTYLELRAKVVSGAGENDGSDLDTVQNDDSGVTLTIQDPYSTPVTDENGNVITTASQQVDVEDLIANGPKNEIYLYPDMDLDLVVTFALATEKTVQIGMKSVGDTTSAKITVYNNSTQVVRTENVSTVDMFYSLKSATKGDTSTYTFAIENTGSSILSLTLLKVCDDPSFAFVKPEPVASSTTEEPELEGWQKIDGVWYYYEENAPKTGWLKDDGKWYYLDSETGAMKTGWQKVDGKWYYLASSGAMKTGWVQVDGKWYYLASSGAMKTGWVKTGGKWYYLASSGAMKTGWAKVDGKWYYLDPDSGAMATGWQTIDGKEYYLTKNGDMVTGDQVIDGETYSFSKSGARINATIF